MTLHTPLPPLPPLPAWDYDWQRPAGIRLFDLPAERQRGHQRPNHWRRRTAALLGLLLAIWLGGAAALTTTNWLDRQLHPDDYADWSAIDPAMPPLPERELEIDPSALHVGEVAL